MEGHKKMYEYSKSAVLLDREWSEAFDVEQVNGRVSSCFSISRGVKQGSVLSQTLFPTVMDLLLRRMRESEYGL